MKPRDDGRTGASNGQAAQTAVSRAMHVAAAAPALAALERFETADGWSLVQTAYSSENAAQDETLFALANGSLGVRGALEEAPSPSDGCFHADAFEQSPIPYHERFTGYADRTDTRVGVARGHAVDILIDGRPLAAYGARIAEFSRTLDLRAGLLLRRTLWQLTDGRRVEVEAERLVSFERPSTLALRFRVRLVDFSGHVSLRSGLRAAAAAAEASSDPRINARKSSGLPVVHVARAEAASGLVQSVRDGAALIGVAQAHRVGNSVVVETDGAADVFSADLSPGGAIDLEKFVAYVVEEGAAQQDVLSQACALACSAQREGFQALAKAQHAAFAHFWDAAQLDIADEPALAFAIRFNLFHIFQSTGRVPGHSTAAKGLTGEGYEGHYFWDTEAYILPVLALTAPELARTMLRYRIEKLDRARAHARGMGHRTGALFPWRTIAGDECSAHYPTGSAQYHINAAIAFALELYVDASGDTSLLDQGGAELLFETARIWLQVGHFNPARGGGFTIHEVTGPDEYTGLVNNNCYTNKMARRHLRQASNLARQWAQTRPQAFASLASRIGLSHEEVETWRRAADAMVIPYETARRLTAQDDEFLDKPVWDFANTPASHYPLLLHYHPLTLFRHQLCKQGDVVLAHVLCGEDVSLAQKTRDLTYYSAVTAHDSTLSSSTFAILSMEAGAEDAALSYLRQTAFVDLNDLHGNASHGAHMAAMAGSWLALVWGLGGFRPSGAGLSLAPRCPAAWSGFRFRLQWRASLIEVEATPQQSRYRLVSGPALTVLHHGRPVTLEHELVLPATVRAPAPDIEAVIFDLDGVLTDTAEAHFRAWNRLASELGVPFDAVFNEQLKGVDRAGSLALILARGGLDLPEDEREALMARKNGYYLEEIADFSPDHLFPGARAVLQACRVNGLRVGLASASRNAPLLLRRLGIADLFDFVADAGAVARSKPAPDIFLAAAAGLGVAPEACLGVEDSRAGLAAIQAAGMRAIGIGDPATLEAAQAVFANIAAFHIADWLDGIPSRPR